MTEFKLNDHKTYLSSIIDDYTQVVIAYSSFRSPNLNQIMDMLNYAWLKDHWIDQSMSRKEISLDGELMYGLFGILSFETQFKNLNELKEAIPKHISYNTKQRTKSKLKGLTQIRALVLS